MKLKSILANRHIFNEQVNGKPLRLLIHFDGGSALRLQVAASGDQMIVDNGPLDAPFDIGEFGRTDIADVTESLFPKLQGLDVTQVEALALNGSCVGVKFSFVRGLPFHFWVDGDELYWGNEEALVRHDWLDGLVPTPAERIQV